jgi:OTT_1508-like deaminase
VVRVIAHAHVIIDKCTSSLEDQWAAYDTGTSKHRAVVDTLETQKDMQGEQVDGGRMDVDTEEDNDHESLDAEEMKKSSIYRFVQKLSRYYVACGVIISELVVLARFGARIDITVETIPISITTSTPAKENEYPSLESFLKQCIQIDVESLDPQKVRRLRDSWPHDRNSQNLFLHAEMQMALFYALNPLLCPIQGFIGVSKKCCWCCDFIFKSVTTATLTKWYIYQFTRHLQFPSTDDAAGPPLLFSISGTHSSKYAAWVFPNPLTHIKDDPLDTILFDKVCHRFKLVRKDLEDALVDEVKVIVGQLRDIKYESDSSSMSGPASLGHLRVLKADEEALNRKRKREDEDGHKNEDD